MSCKQTLIRFLSVFAVLASGWSSVADAQLYAKEAPPGSAFIHVFNGTPASGMNVQIGDKTQPPLLPYSASTYIFVTPGVYVVQAGAHKQSFTLEANHYYTIAATATGLQPFEFSEALTGLKATIAMFNLLPTTTIALKTADGATAVFEDVAPNTSTHRTINPLRLSLALFSGTQKIADVPSIALERGRSFSLFVGGSAAAPVLVWNKD